MLCFWQRLGNQHSESHTKQKKYEKWGKDIFFAFEMMFSASSFCYPSATPFALPWELECREPLFWWFVPWGVAKQLILHGLRETKHCKIAVYIFIHAKLCFPLCCPQQSLFPCALRIIIAVWNIRIQVNSKVSNITEGLYKDVPHLYKRNGIFFYIIMTVVMLFRLCTE